MGRRKLKTTKVNANLMTAQVEEMDEAVKNRVNSIRTLTQLIEQAIDLWLDTFVRKNGGGK